MGCASSVQPVPVKSASPPTPLGGSDASIPEQLPLGGAAKESALSRAETTNSLVPAHGRILQGSTYTQGGSHYSTQPEPVDQFSSGLVYTEVNSNLQCTTAVFHLIKKGQLDELKVLVREAFADRLPLLHGLQGLWGSSPLLVALQYQQPLIAQYLLSVPPDKAVLNAANDKGATALLYAAQEGLTDLLTDLLALGAEPYPDPTGSPIYNPPTDQAYICTPLSIAIINNHRQAVALLLAGDDHNTSTSTSTDVFSFPAMRSSITKGSKGITGMTPLLLAAAHGHAGILRDLLARNRDPTVIDGEGSSILHHIARAPAEGLACLHGLLPYMSLFRDGAPYSGTDAQGNTPLHLAVDGRRDVALIAFLLEDSSGAGVSACNAQGLTPLHLAVRRSTPEVVSLLLSYGANPLVGGKESALQLAQRTLPPTSSVVQELLRTANGWQALSAAPAAAAPPTGCAEDGVTDFSVLDDIEGLAAVCGPSPAAAEGLEAYLMKGPNTPAVEEPEEEEEVPLVSSAAPVSAVPVPVPVLPVRPAGEKSAQPAAFAHRARSIRMKAVPTSTSTGDRDEGVARAVSVSADSEKGVRIISCSKDKDKDMSAGIGGMKGLGGGQGE